MSGGAAGDQHDARQRTPRVLQRSEGFRKMADEAEDLTGAGGAGAAENRPQPAARLLQELVTKDRVHRASVLEVLDRLLAGPPCAAPHATF